MGSRPLRALTLWPEWAWAIHHLDKRVENRIWAIPLEEWFALHAGKHIGGRPGTNAEGEGVRGLAGMAHSAAWGVRAVGTAGTSWSVIFTHATLPSVTAHDPRCEMETANPIRVSAILGLFRVTAHHRPGTTGPWKVPDAIGNVFDYHPLPTPVPCRGAQGLWTVPEDVAAQIEVPRA